MEVFPLSIDIPQEPETIIIEQEEKKYILNIIKEEENIILNILEKDIFPNIKYIKKISLKEIKELHKMFSSFNSCNEFSDFIKSAFENKKINIKKEDKKLILNISVEYLFKNQIIEIPLLEQNINLIDFSKEICQEILLLKERIKILEDNKNDNKLKKEITDLKEENKQLKNEILCFKEELKSIVEKQNNENKNLKEEIKNLNDKIKNIEEKKEIKDKININSVIMKNEEFDMIKNAIESRINKKVKKAKKLYQATIDGGEVSNFHSKCDNIPNTLTIIKSEGNRRFGGFNSIIWESKTIYKYDKNAFLFSLDKNKIYSTKNNNSYTIFCGVNYGPSFGYNKSYKSTIGIEGNPIREKKLYTCESDSDSFDFNGDYNALSEDGKGNDIYAKEYEVFEIKF